MSKDRISKSTTFKYLKDRKSLNQIMLKHGFKSLTNSKQLWVGYLKKGKIFPYLFSINPTDGSASLYRGNIQEPYTKIFAGFKPKNEYDIDRLFKMIPLD